jgi:hypothetical protein
MICKTLLAAVALAVAPLAAQHPMVGPGGMGQMAGDPMMRQMGPAMMRMMLYTPQHLLARKDALGLTADQIMRLTVLRDGAQAAHQAAEVEAQAHMKELEQAANGPKPDTTALKVHFQAAHNAMGNAHWAMLASAAQARTVLTQAQLAKVQAWADSMQAWTQQHRQMMSPAGPH